MTRFDRTKIKTLRARQLRHDATRPEQKHWFRLRGGQMRGFSFRRQHPIGPYVLDFYCAAAKLAVELDGDQHGTTEGRQHDRVRAEFFAKKGIKILRFWNHELKDNFDGVLEGIERSLTPTRSASRTDLPLSGGGTKPH